MPMDFYALAFCNWSEILASFFTNICRQRDYRLRIRNSGSLSLSLSLGGGGRGGVECVVYFCTICLLHLSLPFVWSANRQLFLGVLATFNPWQLGQLIS